MLRVKYVEITMNEQWIPVIYKELTRHNYVESLIYENKNLKIILFDHQNENGRIIISFKDTVLLYRSTNESYAFGRVDAVMKDKKDTNLYTENTIFKVIDSDYVKELSLSYPTIAKNSSLLHFVLIPTDWVIDVIAAKEPLVEYGYGE